MHDETIDTGRSHWLINNPGAIACLCSNCVALRQLRGILHRLLRGEVSYRIMNWREQKQRDARAVQLQQLGSEADDERGKLTHALRREQARRIATSQSAAVQILRAVLLKALPATHFVPRSPGFGPAPMD